MIATRFLATLLLYFSLTTTAFADLVEVDFTGTVFSSFGSPFGVTINPFVSVEGHFFYDTTTPVTYTFSSCATCVGYVQEIPMGFYAEIDGIEFSADQYVVEVSNDVLLSGVPSDTISVLFSSESSSLSESLFVDGNAETGLLSVSFVADASALDSYAFARVRADGRHWKFHLQCRIAQLLAAW